MGAVEPSRTQSGVMAMAVENELKKITKLITNHIVHRLDSIDERLDLQEKVSAKVLTDLLDLTNSHVEMIRKLKEVKIIGAGA